MATSTGWFGGAFVFPHGAVPKGDQTFEMYLDDAQRPIHQKFNCAGNKQGFDELYELCKGNSRLILGLAQSFVGPLTGITSCEPVALQFHGKHGIGKSTAGVVASSTWGWDLKNPKLGFGISWNATTNRLEQLLAGYHQTLAFIDEAAVAPAGNRVVSDAAC